MDVSLRKSENFAGSQLESTRCRFQSIAYCRLAKCVLIVLAVLLWNGAVATQVSAGQKTEHAEPKKFPVSPRLANSPANSSSADNGSRFYRGNIPPTNQQPGISGYYLNWRCWVPVLGLLLLWIWSIRWVSRDSQLLKVRPAFWNTLIFVSGMGGFLTVICWPNFPVAFVLLLLSYTVPLTLYLQERNQYVPEISRVPTFEQMINRVLQLLPFLDDSAERSKSPIEFVGKTLTTHDRGRRPRQVETSQGYLAAKFLVYNAILRQATDIHLEPQEDDEYIVRLRIDGILSVEEPLEQPVGKAVVNIFKVLCALDITQKHVAQSGSFRARLTDRSVDLRVTTQGTQYGEKLSLRILDRANMVNTLPALGLRKSLCEKLRQHIRRPQGLLLNCGSTGTGKTTTLYAILREMDRSQKNVITLEDPIEYKLDGVNQIEIRPQMGQTFETTLRDVLRQDPDVLMVGEIRDQETAELACQAANTGHFVLSTLHAHNTVSAIERLMELNIASSTIANSVTAILGQRLLRRLCADCRVAYQPTAEFFESTGFLHDQVRELYASPTDPQPSGSRKTGSRKTTAREKTKTTESCRTCGGGGYQGRIGVFEYLEISPQLQQLIHENAPRDEIEAQADDEGMLSMQQEGMRLVALGITSLTEFQRIFGQTENRSHD